MSHTYVERLRQVKKNSMHLSGAQPAVMETFEAFHRMAVEGRALDTKVKELMALAISVTHGCDDCIAHHLHDAIHAGATREEITDTLGVAVLMGGGPGMIYASHAIEAMEQFLNQGDTAT